MDMIAFLIVFKPHHFKKWGGGGGGTLTNAGYYVIPSIQNFMFECRSICQRLVFTLYLHGVLFKQVSSNLVKDLKLGRSVLGLEMDKFCQIITELWPLIDVQNLSFVQYLLNKWTNFDKICFVTYINKI